MSDLLSEAPDSEKVLQVARDIHKAAISVGFFYVSGHNIPHCLIDDARTAAINFFELDPDQKETVKVDHNQRGWMPVGMAHLEGAATHDLKEVFFYGPRIEADDPDLLAGMPLVAQNRWPDPVYPQLQVAIRAYHDAMCLVGRQVLSAIAVGFGQTHDCFEPYYRKPLARGQLVYYPNSQASDDAAERFGVAAHTDFGVLTLLFQDDSGGLQVRNRAGEWIEAPPIPGTLVCNTGDLLERWTAGRFKSTVHRVINRSGKSRYSMPVFFDPSTDALIDPRLLDPSSSDNHTVVRAGEHIAARNTRNFTQYDNG